MGNFFHKDSAAFTALQKLSNGNTCNHKQRWQLRKRNLINHNNTLTIHGKTVLYAGILGITVVSFKILALCYVHKKSQTGKSAHPVFYKLVESFFGDKPTSNMYACIRHLIDNNFVKRHYCQHIAITDFAYDTLRQYDGDIVEIESTFEY